MYDLIILGSHLYILYIYIYVYLYIYIYMYIYIYINTTDNIHKDFVVVPIDKATGNIALVCKRFYASCYY